MTLREEFENEVKNNKGGISVLFETSNQHYIDWLENKVKGNGVLADVMAMLPSIDDAGVIAANVASNVKPKLTAKEEAFMIAGFTECVKYLRGQGKGN